MTGRVEDTRYNPLPRRVAVPLYPCPHPQVRTAFAWLRGLSAPGALLEEARALVAAKLHVSPESVSFTSSGSSGLVLALRSVRTDSANEVMVPTFACHRVLEAVLAADMVPVLCDIDGNGNIDPHDMATRLSPRTRAVIATHTFGIPADLSTLSRMCRDADIHLIGDAAQGFGTVYDGRPVGSWGTFGVLSFGRHKPFFAGGGGAVVSGDRLPLGSPLPEPATSSFVSALSRVVLTDRLRRLSTSLPTHVGLQTAPSGDVAEVLENVGSPFDMETSMHWTTAVLLSDQLRRAATYERVQQRHLSRIREAVSTQRGLTFPDLTPGQTVNFLPLQCAPQQRHPIAAHLARHGIETTWLYYPLHRICRFTARWVDRGPFPHAERLWQRSLCLPCRGWHSDRQVARVVHAIADLGVINDQSKAAHA